MIKHGHEPEIAIPELNLIQLKDVREQLINLIRDVETQLKLKDVPEPEPEELPPLDPKEKIFGQNYSTKRYDYFSTRFLNQAVWFCYENKFEYQ